MVRAHLPGKSAASASSRPSSPFGDVKAGSGVAIAFAAASVIWIAWGSHLPGGRWMAVHLFTLGMLTTLLVVFTRHFAQTLTKQPDPELEWAPTVTVIGAVATMVAMAAGWTIGVGLGATVATAGIVGNWWRLRKWRTTALGPRFAWTVRAYERAHGGFVHGAILGGLMGSGLLRGSWYNTAKIAHLEANFLGWAGIVLLATMVFFGPSLARTKIEDGAEATAIRWTKVGSWAVSIATVTLVAAGVSGGLGVALRLLAAAALAVMAIAVGKVCMPVRRAAATTKASTSAKSGLVAVCTWFPVVAWANVVIVAAGAWRWLDALGLAMVVGVLFGAIATTLTWLVPMVLARTRDHRRALEETVSSGGRRRAILHNVGTVLVVMAAALGRDVGVTGAIIARLGWALIAAAVVITIFRVLRTPVTS